MRIPEEYGEYYLSGCSTATSLNLMTHSRVKRITTIIRWPGRNAIWPSALGRLLPHSYKGS